MTEQPAAYIYNFSHISMLDFPVWSTSFSFMVFVDVSLRDTLFTGRSGVGGVGAGGVRGRISGLAYRTVLS